MRFRDVHERPQTATKKGATLGASNVAPIYFKQELLPIPEKLTDTAIRGAKSLEKAYKLADGGGLCLEVTPMRPSSR